MDNKERYDPYAELNEMIEEEDQAQNEDAKRKRRKHHEPSVKHQERRNHKKGILLVICVVLICCFGVGAVYFHVPKQIQSYFVSKTDTRGTKKNVSKADTKSKKGNVSKNDTNGSKRNVPEADTKSKKENVSDSGTKKTDSKSEKKAEPVVKNDGFSYDKANGTAKVVLCGNSFDFPFATNAVADKGWNGVSANADPDNASLTVATWNNVDGSTLYLYYPTGQDGMAVTKADLAFVSNATSFLGLSMDKTFTDCQSLFADADSKDESGFDTSSGAGIVKYSYGSFLITVTLQNSYVTGCSIEKI